MTFSRSLLVLPDCILWEESMARQHKENDCSETNFLPDLASLCPNEEGMGKEGVFVGLPLFSLLCTACSSQKPALYLQDLYAWGGSCVLYPHCCFGSTTAFINWESHREVAHIDVGHTIPNTEIKQRHAPHKYTNAEECRMYFMCCRHPGWVTCKLQCNPRWSAVGWSVWFITKQQQGTVRVFNKARVGVTVCNI